MYGICENCEQKFEKHGNQIYCSDKCRKEYKEKEKERFEERTIKQKIIDGILSFGMIILHMVGFILGAIVMGVLISEGLWGAICIIIGSYGILYIIFWLLFAKFYTGTNQNSNKIEKDSIIAE